MSLYGVAASGMAVCAAHADHQAVSVTALQTNLP